MVFHPVLSVEDKKIGWYISKFCLSWKTLAGISPSFVCHGQYYLVHIPVLSVMNKNDRYITWFFLSLIIIIVISPTFFCRGQNWLVYQPDLFVVVNNGWYINRVSLSWTILVDISPSLFLLWTILVVILTGFVCHGQ